MSVSLDTHTFVGSRGDTCVWGSHWGTLPLHISEGDICFNFTHRKIPFLLIFEVVYTLAWLRNSLLHWGLNFHYCSLCSV